MTGYKRPDLLFSDLERLKNIAGQWPFQIVLAGKAHPQDEGGKRLIETLHGHIARSPAVFQWFSCRTTTCRLRVRLWLVWTCG